MIKNIVILLPIVIASISGPAFADSNPELKIDGSYILSIPQIDSNEIPSLYQDAKIIYAPQDKTWQLLTYTKSIPIQEIADVEVIQTTEMPVQVFLKISGTFESGCKKVGNVGIRKTNTSFKVVVYYDNSLINPPGDIVTCTEGFVSFSKAIPLQVYSLSAGIYSYNVNDVFEGQFTLSSDNTLP